MKSCLQIHSRRSDPSQSESNRFQMWNQYWIELPMCLWLHTKTMRIKSFDRSNLHSVLFRLISVPLFGKYNGIKARTIAAVKPKRRPSKTTNPITGNSNFVLHNRRNFSLLFSTRKVEAMCKMNDCWIWKWCYENNCTPEITLKVVPWFDPVGKLS